MPLISVLLSASLLTACNSNVNDDKVGNPEDTNNTPVQQDIDNELNRNIHYHDNDKDEVHDYDSYDNRGKVNIQYDRDIKHYDDFYHTDDHLNHNSGHNDNGNQTKGDKPFKHPEDPDQTNLWEEKGHDQEFNKNKGAE